MDAFKVPHGIPQDLLLIHDIIGNHTSPPPLPNFCQPSKVATLADDDIESSSGETASEDEIEATLTAVVNEEEHSEPDSNSGSSSESDSEKPDTDEKGYAPLDTDDEEEDETTQTTETLYRTQSEIPEANVVVPDITEVGQDEVLERVGEIITIMGNTVVVNGLSSEMVGRGSERALDSETLLVFNDRKVMGYIYETFGPTSQPLYQVKFNKDFPLDSAQVKVSREVFHVPARSNFVFMSSLQTQKGSDASNMHDEEPGENELEFSDDEAEVAHRATLKKRRQYNFQSVISSRHTTPTPSQMHDQDMMEASHLSRNPYDERGLYDDEFGPGPSRPPPIPYDDPYSDSYTTPDPISKQETNLSQIRQGFSSRGRSRRDGRRGRRGHNRHSGGLPQPYGSQKQAVNTSNGGSLPSQPAHLQHIQSIPRPMSPTSLAIVRATGQLSNVFDPSFQQDSTVSSLPATATDGSYYRGPPTFRFGAARYPQAFIQPHINPRFATALGINMGMTPTYNQSIPPYAPQNSLHLSWPTSSTSQTEERTDPYSHPPTM